MVVSTKTKQFQNWFYCSGRELQGVQFAMDFLEKNQKKQLGKDFQNIVVNGWFKFYLRLRVCVTHLSSITPPGYLNDDVTNARDKNVIVIGGGDTGVDCVATCVRQVQL
jgi:NADPH-dependent glutamate synthase beta subunit-like oxidoreductase